MNLIFFSFDQGVNSKIELKTFATTGIDAVFRPFLVDTSIEIILGSTLNSENISVTGYSIFLLL